MGIASTIASVVGRAAMVPFAKALPSVGETERAALNAGSVGFEGELFAGRPDFDSLRARGANRLTPEEQYFLDNDVRRLVAMLDDFAIDEARDLPAPVWAFLREHKFFGMIIPRQYGGLGFGHYAHAAVITRIATVNVPAAVTAMVPNSLGPAELLLRYGTHAQKLHYLPRLADGRDLPCFALTGPYAGSDAASIRDMGVMVEKMVDGRVVRGFVVNFDKRYITLAPAATVVGLAFMAIDPRRPQGEQELGITCALIPVPTAGMDIGRRHLPMNSAFMNGPIRGAAVFVPMEWVIGGEAQVGQGWRMLMDCLAAGRAISLPALGAAMQQTSLFVAHGYGHIREQFGLPVGKFHAVAAIVARMAVDLYASDAARRYTAAALDAGEQPSVASAMLKVKLTEAGRRAVNDGMDILGGKGIMRGPRNLLGVMYRHAPIAITVEGANLLTRSLIVFGQGAVRCHPYVLAEMDAVQAQDASALGSALIAHAGHVLRNAGRSLFGPTVQGTHPAELRQEAEQIARLSAQFALTVDLAMGLLGGQLKRLELLSARLADVLCALYLASSCVWRYEMDGEAAMLPIARAAVRAQLALAAQTLRDLQANLPGWSVRWLAPVLNAGTRRLRPLDDATLLALADSLRADTRLLPRLCPDMGRPRSGGLFDLMLAVEASRILGKELPELNRVLRRTHSLEDAAAAASDPTAALAYLKAADRVIQVDDFAPAKTAQTGVLSGVF
ncbi:MAG: acyl-CoA dehydrogenase [Pseudomonadota bacterium]